MSSLAGITVWNLPYESVEWIGPLTVLANGVATGNFKVCLLADGVRPIDTDWIDPTPDGADWGVMYDKNAKGSWKIWIKYTSGLETIVLDNVGIVVAH